MSLRTIPASRRRRTWLGTIGVLLALSASAPTADAYNQAFPPGDPNTIGDCTDTGGGPCIRWAKTASNLSINVDVYLHSSLTSEEINLKTIALDSMGKYNAIAARNPHLQQTTSTSNDEIYVYVDSLSSPYTYGVTTLSVSATTDRILFASMVFNSRIGWNTTYTYACGSATPVFCVADAHKVVSHEFGHAEGLAHEASTVVAIMVQGEPWSQYHAVKQDDKNGIIHIYGAYP